MKPELIELDGTKAGGKRGVVQADDKRITLTCDPDLEYDDQDPYYRVYGTDQDGNEYEVRWQPYFDDHGLMPSQEAGVPIEDDCDWDYPDSIRRV